MHVGKRSNGFRLGRMEERERETSEQRSWLESPAAGCFGVGRRKEESGIVLKQG